MWLFTEESDGIAVVGIHYDENNHSFYRATEICFDHGRGGTEFRTASTKILSKDQGRKLVRKEIEKDEKSLRKLNPDKAEDKAAYEHIKGDIERLEKVIESSKTVC